MMAIGSDRPYGGVGPAERRAERRARIVEGALEVFASRGYAGASVEAICQAASVSTRDFYVKFESREACLRAIYDSIVAEITRDVIDRLESADGTLAGEARAALTGFVECFARDERKARVNFVEAVGGRWVAMGARTETYHVNRCEPPICSTPSLPSTVTQTIWSTVHGPVIYTDPSGRFAITQRRIQRSHWAQSFVGLDGFNRHSGLAAFNADADLFTGTYNMLYDDAAGHAMYRFAGWQPVRAPGIDRRLPTPGGGEYEWRGRLSPRQMPHYVSSRRDILVVNQGTESKPIWWWPNSSSVFVGQVSRVASNQRLLRALGSDIDVDRFQTEVYPKLLERQDAITPVFAGLLRHALAHARDQRLRQAFELFQQWAAAGFPRVDANHDGLYDSPALTIFGADDFNLPATQYPRYLWSDLLRRVFADELGPFALAGTGSVEEPMTWLAACCRCLTTRSNTAATRNQSRR